MQCKFGVSTLRFSHSISPSVFGSKTLVASLLRTLDLFLSEQICQQVPNFGSIFAPDNRCPPRPLKQQKLNPGCKPLKLCVFNLRFNQQGTNVLSTAVGNDHFCDTTERASQSDTTERASQRLFSSYKGGFPCITEVGRNPLIPQPWS